MNMNLNKWEELGVIDVIPADIKFIVCNIQNFNIYMSSERFQDSTEYKKLFKTIKRKKNTNRNNLIIDKYCITKPQIIPWLKGLQKSGSILLRHIWFIPYNDRFVVFSTTQTDMKFLNPREIHNKQ